MKIAITSQNQRTVSGHAGKTTRFVVYTIENEKIVDKGLIELEKDNVLHEHFHGNPAPGYVHPVLEMDVIITGSMGPGFPIKMKLNGIEAIKTDEKDLDVVINKYLAGTLEKLPPDAHHHH
jgi:predicted Fe-Mo cluster-binding NifX family protein